MWCNYYGMAGFIPIGKCSTERKEKGEECKQNAQCAQGLWCKYTSVSWRRGKCSTEHMKKGEECMQTSDCVHGLECNKGPIGAQELFGKCSTKRKSQYFWLVIFGPKLGQIRLILDTFAAF